VHPALRAPWCELAASALRVRRRTDVARGEADRSGSGLPPTLATHTRRSIMARKVLAVLMMLGMFGTLSALSGCNTMAGAGKDIERGGQKVQEEAKEVQQKL
jgi:entericidin B